MFKRSIILLSLATATLEVAGQDTPVFQDKLVRQGRSLQPLGYLSFFGDVAKRWAERLVLTRNQPSSSLRAMTRLIAA